MDEVADRDDGSGGADGEAQSDGQEPADGTAAAGETMPQPSTPQPNLLLLIADDFGVESSPCYRQVSGQSAANALPTTPRLDALCEAGMVFDNVWSSPTCSPTRSGILTGRHGFRTGVGEQATGRNGIEIGADELTLPRVLDEAETGYRHASFGKWHLGGDANNPNTMGWSHFSGLLTGALRSYETWSKTENGETIQVERYATSEIVDDALEWITNGSAGEARAQAPWLAWVAFNAPHTPFHLPPAELHSAELSGTPEHIEAEPLAYYNAAVEALDTEIGRLLDGIDPQDLANTVVVFIGDNGTPGGVSSHRQGQSKGGLYEGGIHVPMVVSGPGVVAGRSEALVGTIDVFATFLDLAGVDMAGALDGVVVDSVSFVDVLVDGEGAGSGVIMSEIFGTETRANRQGKTIRDDRYKVIEFTNGSTEFFDLVDDPRGESPIEAAARSEGEVEVYENLLTTLQAWTVDPTAARPE